MCWSGHAGRPRESVSPRASLDVGSALRGLRLSSSATATWEPELASALSALGRPSLLPTAHREFDTAVLSCRQHMGQQTRWAGDLFSLARDDAVAGLQSSRVRRAPGPHTAEQAPVRTRDRDAQDGTHGRLGTACRVSALGLCRNPHGHRSLGPGCLVVRLAIAASRVTRQLRSSGRPHQEHRPIAKGEHCANAKQPSQPSSHVRLPLTVRYCGHPPAAPWSPPAAGTRGRICGPPASPSDHARASLPQSAVS